MFKNVAAKFIVFAFDTTTGVAKTGDAANLTAYVSKDYGTVTVLADTSATEMDSTKAPGYYLFDAAQGETNADCLHVTGKSTTSNISVIGAPSVIYTRPTTGWLAPATAGRTLVVDAAGLADANVVKIGPTGAGSAQTAGDLFARIGAAVGSPTAQTISDDLNAVLSRLPSALVSGRMDSSVGAMAANVITATAINADAITDAKVAADVTIASVTGAVGSVTGAVGSVTGNVGGNVTGSVGSVAAGGITASSIAADAITDAKVAADVTIASVTGSVGSVTGAVGSVTGNVGGNVTGSVGSVVGAVGSVTGLTAADVGAIKVKTDNLPSDPADQSLVMAATDAVMARLGAPAGASVSADIAAISLGSTPPTVDEIADEVETRGLQLTSAYDFAKGTVAMTEAYAADGSTMTPVQALYMLWSLLAERSIVLTTLTAKKLDGSTSAMTFTLDSATTPTSQTRAT